MITRDDGYSWVPPRITEQGFVKVLSDYGSPAAAFGAAAYRAINRYHVDPLFLLAQFRKESTFGKFGHATRTFSWGNMRDGRDVQDVPTVTGSDGGFMKFADWIDGAAATAAHFDTGDYRGLTIAEGISRWAPPSENDTEGYIRSVLADMNEWSDIQMPEEPTTRRPRIIVSAGHENIGDITADHIGQESANSLRNGTGALGTEATYNGAVADALVKYLSDAGADVIRTDAVYHEDVYGTDADLVIFCHADGASGTPDGQWAGASVVHSGPSTEDVDAKAQAWVDNWAKAYPGVTKITDYRLTENPTRDMLQYYGGNYRTANTPAVLVEHGLYGDANGRRQDAPEPSAAALGDAQATALTFDLKGVPLVSNGGSGKGTDGGNEGMAENDRAAFTRNRDGSLQSIYYKGTKHSIVTESGFGRFYQSAGFPNQLGNMSDFENGHASPVFGLPITQEFTIVDPRVRGGKPTTVQYFERARLEWVPDEENVSESTNGGHVEMGRVGLEAMEGLPTSVIPPDAFRG